MSGFNKQKFPCKEGNPQRFQIKNFCSTEQMSIHSSIPESRTTKQENTTDSHNSTPCKVCGCTRLNVILEKPPATHYAAKRCGGCDVFRGWLPKPQTLKRQQDQRKIIEQLLKNPRLTDWERNFCSGLGKKISPKQAEILSRIIAERGGAA